MKKMFEFICGLFEDIMEAAVMFPITCIGQFFVRIADCFGAACCCRWYIRKEFARAIRTILDRDTNTCASAINVFAKLKCIPDFKGFDSVITLLRHRHRTRALERLGQLVADWGCEKIELKRSKPDLLLVPDNNEETRT